MQDDPKFLYVDPPANGGDATELLQKALDEAHATGQDVYLRAGEYRLSSPLTRLVRRIVAVFRGEETPK